MKKTSGSSDSKSAVSKVHVINRDTIPGIETITASGETHNLGKLLDFRKNKVLASFIPEKARLSVSWVKLDQGQVLDTHQHPTSSMIIVCEGQGEVVGDCQQSLNTGDIIVVPPNRKHGFIGHGKNGFWGLSIQFEGLGLYEDRNAPRVKFVGDEKEKNTFDLLLDDQRKFEKKFLKNPLVKLVTSDKIKDPKIKERLLEALNFWSNWFQKIIFERAAIEREHPFQELAEQHLSEEIGHNTDLLNMRRNKPVTLWDPILDSSASWFYEKMLTAPAEDKTVLIHFVLESASSVFHHAAAPIFHGSHYFDLHKEADEEHFEMGCRALRERGSVDIPHLRKVLFQGWSVFEVIATRMANHALGKE